MESADGGGFQRLGGDGPGLAGAALRQFGRPFRSARALRDSLLGFLPCLRWLRSYQTSFLYGDLVGGLTVGIMNVPQGEGRGGGGDRPPRHRLRAAGRAAARQRPVHHLPGRPALPAVQQLAARLAR